MKKVQIMAILMTAVIVSLVVLYRTGVASGGASQVGHCRSITAASTTSSIPYQGRLSASSGEPVSDGIYALRFTLYADQDAKDPLWSEQQVSVPVQGGFFQVLLGSLNPLQEAALESERLYLETAVRAPGEGDFTPLYPPQVLQVSQPAAPSGTTSDMACPHDHVGETWIQPAYANGLKIQSTGGGYGLVAESNTDFWAAIEGNNSGSAAGVYGYSNSGFGVLGRSNSGYGGVFDSGNDSLDLQVRGNIGRINANEYDGSVLYLSSNGNIVNKLDNDGGESHYFQIANSNDAVVFYVDELGNVWKNGTILSMVNTPQSGSRTLYAMESAEM